ncbi:hypothetical protein AWB67_04604 [Caballeronia terrestris]|uniref:Uncharacterized protein n=1 Tax=Caballeronia terrestris TaxID=1226301 RepID=A0A158JZW2_9BURK|nr:hypothetical protein AWB67_04604 [Caballeronia terrestris]
MWPANYVCEDQEATLEAWPLPIWLRSRTLYVFLQCGT